MSDDHNRQRAVHPLKLHNEGSTLITVMVGISFMIVLATIIISVSSVSLQMKQVAYVSERNFYSDEQLLSDIYNGIGNVANQCLTQTYTEILARISDNAGTVQYEGQDEAFQAFSENFVDRLMEAYPDDGTPAQRTVVETKLNSYLTGSIPNVRLDSYGGITVENQTITLGAGGTRIIPFQFIFEDVKVVFPDPDHIGFESVITTDIVIEVPYINFFRSSSMLLEYAMVGNEGIYFENGQRTVTGNVYAGINRVGPDANPDHRENPVWGGINFLNAESTLEGNYLISRGNMNVRNSTVTVGNPPGGVSTQVWMEGIRMQDADNRLAVREDPVLTINGSAYVANDLELNARGSQVTLSGEYYGYNNARYVTEEEMNILPAYDTAQHATSSSIIINGDHSDLDMTQLNTMIIAGLAYIDLNSRSSFDRPLSELPPGGGVNEYQTGESLALKANQSIYLAPASCLTTTNPVEGTPFDNPALEATAVYQETNPWFQDLLADPPIEARVSFNKMTGTSFTYYYLNFATLDSQMEYVETILSQTIPEPPWDISDPVYQALKDQFDGETGVQQLYDMQKSLINKSIFADSDLAGVESAVITGNIFNQGLIMGYDRGTSDLITYLVQDTQRLSLDYAMRLQTNIMNRFQELYMTLNPREEFSLTSGTLPAPGAPRAGQPLSEFVDLGALTNNWVIGPNAVTQYRNHSFGTIIRNSNDYTVEANQGSNMFMGIIISAGNVIVPDGMNVSGLILAGGKIYVRGSGRIEANGAAVQAILDEEMTEESQRDATAPERADFAITYLTAPEFQVEPSGVDNTRRISSADYRDYMSYQNWRQG